uniref:Mitochondrial ribosomal protein S28 n=1 Tax=Phallusia mammillata TaxID=59560 RepID=A0A6F9DLZ2_9ASCI|nr:Mitochondrial ribosomal protein S28 [Phallusia mammillata]
MSAVAKLCWRHKGLNIRLFNLSQKRFASGDGLSSMDHVLANIGTRKENEQKDEKAQSDSTPQSARQLAQQPVQETSISTKKPKSFATLLRNSGFIHLGQFKNSYAVGKILEIQDNNAFVDFGGKFHFVCPIPEENQEEYRRGRLVSVMLHDFELSARFLGASKDTTLLEASGHIIGLLRKRNREEPKSFKEEFDPFIEPEPKP